MALTTGTVLQDRYRIVAELGQGGMGAVYRAWDMRLKKPVALKEMVPQPGLDEDTLSQYRTQFEQEAVTLGKLKHPCLVPVTDYFEEGSRDYLAMEFVEGENLADQIVREGAVPEPQVVLWAAHLLDALDYCHALGVIHRDIKPQNVIITPQGRAILVDFGLVKLWDPTDPQTRTVMRGVGTPEYAPPEQWGTLGHHTDPRSDLYSLGATLYHALVGKAPLTASDRMAYPAQYKTPRELMGCVSEAVDAAIARSMALSIDDRWADAAAMAQGLGVVPATSDPDVAVAVSTPGRTPETTEPSEPDEARRSGSRRWLLPVGVIAGVTVLACVVVGALSAASPEHQEWWVFAFLVGVPGLSLSTLHFTTDRKPLWAVVLGGLLTTFAVFSLLVPFAGTGVLGSVLFLGIWASFALVYLWAKRRRRMWWALVLAGLSGAMGLLMLLAG
jgi:eukaryotic-like serine/threonine-protein kinase